MPHPLRKPAKVGLVIAMLFAGMMIWLGDPLVWIWIGSQVTESQQAGMGPYALVAGGILASTILWVWVLLRLNQAYDRLHGGRQTVRVRLPWARSLRDEPSGAQLTVFDTVLVFTALMGLVSFLAWFIFLAGSPLPG